MMGLDFYNSLDQWPLPGMSEFLTKCNAKGVKEINITGSNTDPALFKHHDKLTKHLRHWIPNATIGVRTNGVILGEWLNPYDKGSFSITSLHPEVYRKTMGSGSPPDPRKLMDATKGKPWKINIVLTPEGLHTLESTMFALAYAGFTRINLREPYGQQHIGDPLAKIGMTPDKQTLGMPTYRYHGAEVTYWDVHYVHVESINLYASGRVSVEYPISRGHAPDGVVKGQENFEGHRRRTEQWVSLTQEVSP